MYRFRQIATRNAGTRSLVSWTSMKVWGCRHVWKQDRPALALRGSIRRIEDVATLDCTVAAGLASRYDSSKDIDFQNGKILRDSRAKFMTRLFEYGGSDHFDVNESDYGKAICGSSTARKAWREAAQRASDEHT